jgi:branched-chain amino acid transport system permease protein
MRDALSLALFVAVLIGLSYLLDAIPIAGMAYYNRIIVLMGVNITLAVSLNIINGHAGQFSLGHAGFMAIGAYFAAFLTVTYFSPYIDKLPANSTQQWVVQQAFLLIGILAGGTLAAIAGYLVGLPSLRLRGDYLAIVTLGFGEIIRVLILNIDQIGAARGLSGIPQWSNFFWVYLLAGITILISWRLVNSAVGRAFLAVREDQIAAEAMGVDTTKYKVKAFIIGSFLAGAAGALFAHYLMYLNPTMFTFMKSFEVVVMVVLGGLGSISGSVIAAIIITFLPEGLRPVKDLMPGPLAGKDPRMIIYSLTLIILMLTRPQGLLGRRELWEVLTRRKDSTGNKRDEKSGPPIQ